MPLHRERLWRVVQGRPCKESVNRCHSPCKRGGCESSGTGPCGRYNDHG
jgi:hypothetical protein